MKPFKWMFEEQNATEIEYKGKQVSALYRYDKRENIVFLCLSSLSAKECGPVESQGLLSWVLDRTMLFVVVLIRDWARIVSVLQRY